MLRTRAPAPVMSALVLVAAPFLLGALLVAILALGYERGAALIYGLAVGYYRLPLALAGMEEAAQVELFPLPVVVGAAVFYAAVGVVLHWLVVRCARPFRSAGAAREIRPLG